MLDPIVSKLISLGGFLFFLLIAYILSENKQGIAWRTVIWGIALQLIIALIVLKTSMGYYFFYKLGQLIINLLDVSKEGARFVFGNLVDSEKSWGFLFFAIVLPTIIFMSSLMSLLYYLGIMQKLVKLFAWIMMKTMKLSGAESLAAASNVFVGQTEAPLMIRPYVSYMTRSEIMSLMTGGMATVAGGVLVAYVGFGIDPLHLLTASVISAPASLLIAKMLVPEIKQPQTLDLKKIDFTSSATNVLEAVTEGATTGLRLAANVGAMLIAFVSLVAFINLILKWGGTYIGFSQLSFELIMGYLNAPLAWLMGVPWKDCVIVGGLLGKKIVLNEFIGYLDLAQVKASLDQRSVIIATYALCGFANFSSIGIQIGGINALASNQKLTLVQLGFKSLIGGTLACYLTACIAGILID